MHTPSVVSNPQAAQRPLFPTASVGYNAYISLFAGWMSHTNPNVSESSDAGFWAQSRTQLTPALFSSALCGWSGTELGPQCLTSSEFKIIMQQRRHHSPICNHHSLHMNQKCCNILIHKDVEVSFICIIFNSFLCANSAVFSKNTTHFPKASPHPHQSHNKIITLTPDIQSHSNTRPVYAVLHYLQRATLLPHIYRSLSNLKGVSSSAAFYS